MSGRAKAKIKPAVIPAQKLRSPIFKRSIVIGPAGHKTSVSLEDDFWHGLRVISFERSETLSEAVTKIDQTRKLANLSSAIRLCVLKYYREKACGPDPVVPVEA